jgi:hypothetical protein
MAEVIRGRVILKLVSMPGVLVSDGALVLTADLTADRQSQPVFFLLIVVLKKGVDLLRHLLGNPDPLSRTRISV